MEGSPAWRHDLGRVAFATVPGTFSGQGDDAVRWTVWVADLKAGRLQAFLPSRPLPDLTQTELPLLAWSPDGQRLQCGGEAFEVE